MLRRPASMCLKLQVVLSLTLMVLLSVLNPGVAFAEDPSPGKVLVRGTVVDNDDDPIANRRVTFTLIDLSTEAETWVGECYTNSLGNYQFPQFHILDYVGTHEICLQAGGDPVRYAALEGELVHDFLIVNHGTINIQFVDGDGNPVGSGVPFWLLSKRPGDPFDPLWPDGYALDGDLERTTNASGIISVFADKAYVYQYDQSGAKRYIWYEPDGVRPWPYEGSHGRDHAAGEGQF